jgi:hypothetical protein
MPYYFVENRYPQNDVNIDLNFGNDILYGEIAGDELDKYRIPNKNGTPDNNVVPFKRGKPRKQKIKNENKPSTFMSLLFIIIVIFVVLAWYIYSRKENKKKIIEINPYLEPELTIISPEIRSFR